MSREPATRDLIERALKEIGRRYPGSGRLYVAGGAAMVILGFRTHTEDIDYTVQLEGRHEDFVAAVRSVMRELNVSTEPAGPGDFIPMPSGWVERSRFIGRYGRLDVFGMDPVSTVLSKIERGSARDIADATKLVQEGIVSKKVLKASFADILPRLEAESLRVDEGDFRRKFEAFFSGID